MKKVVYLGGFFQCEFSMQKSFSENGAEIVFLIDTGTYAKDYWNTPLYSNYDRSYSFIKVVPENRLMEFIKEFKPDVIIHRHWMFRPVMHLNSFPIARKLGIPFVHLEMETMGPGESLGQLTMVDCDIFLYAHDCIDFVTDQLVKMKIRPHFYSYGVSNFERGLLNVPKDREIGGFGHPRFEETTRVDNLNMFLEGLSKIGKKMHIYGDWNFNPWLKNYEFLEKHLRYNLEDATIVMNHHKIAINFETLPGVEGAYSHKMFQTIGCGIPTLTHYKLSLLNMFYRSPNPIFVRNSDEVASTISSLISNEKEIKRIGEGGEKYIHENFDWFQRFDKIMKEEGIW